MPHTNTLEGRLRRREKRKNRVRHRNFYLDGDESVIAKSPRAIKASGLYKDLYTGRQVALLKGVWTRDSMGRLAEFLLSYKNAWQFKLDKRRGPKYFFITGRWCAQGRFRWKKDKTYLAGIAGKLDVPNGYPEINEFVQSWGETASLLLRRKRPDLCAALDALPVEEKKFGDFPLFMAARGAAKMHKDLNDVVSVLVLIKSTPNCGGGLEIGGANMYLDWDVGDAIILDSSELVHGTREYLGNIQDRIVGIFILHKAMLRIHNVPLPQK